MSDPINTGAYLRELLDALVANLHAQLAAAGHSVIRPSHGWVFQYITDEGSRVTELAAKAGITKQSMSALVYQLEEWGYLAPKPDPADRRAQLYCLTSKGTELRKLGRGINQRFEQQWAQKLGVARYQQFRECLQVLGQ
ncbi:MarR family winged helix-turn-helix transcriptional regulator [Hymenobacter oligotrophus]|nr:MarR family winged helix-turn-helix transcriptional regulator [Hymenobacter oligotrophus]